ncbi:MAG: S-layer homology domain-containing protein [Clostridia bacterium]|nr:S-layer homology domain-containing protein [Clostridia bacterium]
MKKRVISLILTLIFVLTLVPAAALTGSAASAYYNVVMFPIVKQVQSATGAEPGEQVFEFEITGTMAPGGFDVIENTVTTNGTGRFEGYLTLGVYTESDFWNLTEGFTVREKPIDSSNWSCDTTEYLVRPYLDNVTINGRDVPVVSAGVYNLSEDPDPDLSYPERTRKEMIFTNYYFGDGNDDGYYYVLDVPIYKGVESTDGTDPGKHTFTIEISEMYANAQFDILENTVTAPGLGGYYEGHFVIGIYNEESFWNLSEGFVIREKNTGDPNWIFSETEYYIIPYAVNMLVGRDLVTIKSFAIYNKTAGDEIDYRNHTSDYDGAYFVNTYDPPKSEFVTLTYDPNGGSVQNPTRTYKRGDTAILDEPAFREGYTFTGWYNAPSNGQLLTMILMDSDKTVYAGWKKTDVPEMLNGSDHIAYVKGYPDGMVRPSKNITRAEVATIFYRLLKPEVRNAYHSTLNNFADVKSTDWFNEAVSTMANLGIVKGRSSDTFAPNAPITRAEYATICARFDTSIVVQLSSFSDISDHWAKDYILRAAALGWIRGYTDGTFKPNQQISRAESITLTNRVLQRLPQSPSDLLSGMIYFPDNADITSWYYLPIQEATNAHEYTSAQDGHEVWTKLLETTMP